jgi:isoleucyl-tRNA synthetase
VDEALSVDILKDLKERGLLFDKENYAHSYPFCWRCKTRLIYYARDSWYIRMSELRDDLVSENEKINWEPEYIKEGRFGEWLREVKDWAISRERYWGTPLPIWQSEDGSRVVVDSIDTLKKFSKKSGNKYFVMRHGGTEGNQREIVSYKNQSNDHLTPKGKEQAALSASQLKNDKIDLIFTSTFARTKETADIVAKSLGLSPENIIEDERLIEVNPGEFDGKDWNEYHKTMYSLGTDWFTHTMPGGESMNDVRKRMGEFIYEIEEKYKDKNILIVTHGGPAWILYVASGLYSPEKRKYQIPDTRAFVPEFKRFENAEIRELPFVPLPHNKDYAVDLHKPYIDDAVLINEKGEEMKRVKEVMDVWLDSGAVPFAQDAGDREKPGDFKNILYPADFISEAIDQTRGWFYTMHAIGVLMERGRAYKNVICLGHLLDKDGKKMSKSIGNVVDPWEQMDKYGVDTLRLWMYSINQAGESKRFDERSVDEIQKRIFNLIDNIYSFYELYRDNSLEKPDSKPEPSNVLDKWILVRLSLLAQLMTDKLDNYRLLEPVRAYRDFVDDLSTWYLRRSRDRIKEGDKEAKETLYFVLKQMSKLLAPLAPFYSEGLYQKLKTDVEPISVHLSLWPEQEESFFSRLAHRFNAKSDAPQGNESSKLISDMQETRRIVSIALEARSRANIKVRQPLQELRIKNADLKDEFKEIIREELNVKSVKVDQALSDDVELDTELTEELKDEGRMRDIVRAIQDLRKEKNLKPEDSMDYEIAEDEREIFSKFRTEIEKVTNIKIANL